MILIIPQITKFLRNFLSGCHIGSRLQEKFILFGGNRTFYPLNIQVQKHNSEK